MNRPQTDSAHLYPPRQPDRSAQLETEVHRLRDLIEVRDRELHEARCALAEERRHQHHTEGDL
jgi:hypothetical protein